MNTRNTEAPSPARTRRFLQEMGLTPVWLPRATAEQVSTAQPSLDEAAATALATDHANVEIAGKTRDDTADQATGELKREQTTQLADEDFFLSMPASFNEADDAGHQHQRQHNAVMSAGSQDERYAPEAITGMDWATLKDTVSDCVKCGLCKGRTRTVFGTGDEQARWLFIGEGPGRNEDQQGQPFVGQAGKLLDNILLEMNLRRGSNAYIANVVKCRPTDVDGRDRAPTAEEAAACLPYLQRQIALIRPSVLVALGKTAAISLLELDAGTPVGSLRGKVHRYQDLPLIVTYHPAYVLRKLTEKSKVWIDLSLAMEAYAGEDVRQHV